MPSLPYEIDALLETNSPEKDLLEAFRYYIDHFRFPVQMLSEMEIDCLVDNFNNTLVEEHNAENRSGAPEQLHLYEVSSVLEYPVWLHSTHIDPPEDPNAVDDRKDFAEWYAYWLKSLEEQENPEADGALEAAISSDDAQKIQPIQ